MDYSIRTECITPSSTSPVSLATIKQYLRINNTENDDLISELSKMATRYAEWYLGKTLSAQAWQLTCIGIIPSKISLPFEPINNISSISFTQNNQTKTLVLNKDYIFEKEAAYVEFLYNLGDGKVTIQYSNGYESEELVPHQIREGLLHHTAYAFNNENLSNSEKFFSFIKRMYYPFKKITL